MTSELVFPKSIVLVGAGKMGGALLSSWLRAGLPAQTVTVVETNRALEESLTLSGVKVVQTLDSTYRVPECIVLAIKPQGMDDLLRHLAVKFGSRPLYLSVAAGKTLDYYATLLGTTTPIIRAMPNAPATIGKAITALCANGKCGEPHKQQADALFKAAGEVVWLDKESLMNGVTAISGSGPAYVFLFIEAMVTQGMSYGLSEKVARQFATQTVAGSGALAHASEESLETLRKGVTSPGGTTEAALGVLMKGDALKKLLSEAMASAAKRAQELS